MAIVQVLGRISKEVKIFDEGKKISFSIADNSNEDAQYFDVVYRNYDKLTSVLEVGKSLMVSGSLVIKKNETEKGTFTNVIIYAHTIQLT